MLAVEGVKYLDSGRQPQLSVGRNAEEADWTSSWAAAKSPSPKERGSSFCASSSGLWEEINTGGRLQLTEDPF